MSPSTSSPRLRRLGLPWLLVAAFMLGSVSSGGAFAAGMIRSRDIVDGQVMRPDLANDAVTGAKVRNGTIGRDDLASPVWISVAPAHETNVCNTGQVSTYCGFGPANYNFHWRNHGDGWQPVRFRRDVTGVVEIEGVARGSFADRTAFILPEEYRPPSGRVFTVSCANTAEPAAYVAGRVSVYADGRVYWEPGDTCNPATYISLDGIRFAT